MDKKEASLTQIIRDPAKRRAWVKYQFHLQGRSMAQLAAEVGVERCTLYWVFKRPYPRMERIVADALGMTPQELFPERYDALGLPNRTIGRPRKYSVKDTDIKETRTAKQRKVA